MSDIYEFVGADQSFKAPSTKLRTKLGQLEHDIMPLDETLAIMRVMDEIRQQWGLVYPSERSA